MEKDAAAAAAADGRRCTVCGAEAALRCDCDTRRRTDRCAVNAADRLRSDSETPAAGGGGLASSTDSATSAHQKRVRFMQQRQKSEPGHVAAEAPVERSTSDANATAAATTGTVPPPPSKANSVDSSAAKKSSKSRSSKGRGGGVRADSVPAGVGSGGATHRKSCCVS